LSGGKIIKIRENEREVKNKGDPERRLSFQSVKKGGPKEKKSGKFWLKKDMRY